MPDMFQSGAGVVMLRNDRMVSPMVYACKMRTDACSKVFAWEAEAICCGPMEGSPVSFKWAIRSAGVSSSLVRGRGATGWRRVDPV